MDFTQECIDQGRSVYMRLLTWTVHRNLLMGGGGSVYMFIDMDCTQEFIDQGRSVYMCLLTWTIHRILLIRGGQFTCVY